MEGDHHKDGGGCAAGIGTRKVVRGEMSREEACEATHCKMRTLLGWLKLYRNGSLAVAQEVLAQTGQLYLSGRTGRRRNKRKSRLGQGLKEYLPRLSEAFRVALVEQDKECNWIDLWQALSTFAKIALDVYPEGVHDAEVEEYIVRFHRKLALRRIGTGYESFPGEFGLQRGSIKRGTAN